MNENTERELGWDDEIENDSPDFVILPEGDYEFEVTGYERARHGGSEKLPPCNKAIVKIKIDAPEGTTTINHNLFLYSKVEGLLCSFFTSIGHRKKGEKLKMNWNAVTGCKGRCKLGIRKWKSEKDGREYQSNEIKKFYEPDESKQESNVKFQAGSF